MAPQLTALNARVLGLVDQIVRDDPNGVVILFSDHGDRYDWTDRTESVHNFFAARTPGHTAVFPKDLHPINLFPHLFRAYFGADTAVREHAAWISVGTTLNLQRVD